MLFTVCTKTLKFCDTSALSSGVMPGNSNWFKSSLIIWEFSKLVEVVGHTLPNEITDKSLTSPYNQEICFCPMMFIISL